MKNTRRKNIQTSWENLASWYSGWAGGAGSKYHKSYAIPTILNLLNVKEGESVLDVGSGTSALAFSVTQRKASYVGVDASPTMVREAKKSNLANARFYIGDAKALHKMSELTGKRFDSVVFLLSIQDMDPLDEVIESASRVLKPNGKLIIFMLHPAFRIPRHSGFLMDENRKILVRRTDRYMSSFPIPIEKRFGKKIVKTAVFHRPISEYFSVLTSKGFVINDLKEIVDSKALKADKNQKELVRGEREFPLFLSIRAIKQS